MADITNLIGTQHNGYTFVAQKPYSFHEDDAHLLVVLGYKGPSPAEATEVVVWNVNLCWGEPHFYQGSYGDNFTGGLKAFNARAHTP